MRPEESWVEQVVIGGLAVEVVQTLGGSLVPEPF